VLVVGFGLFSVFLAILIDGYESAKEEQDARPDVSVGQELRDIAEELWRRVVLPAGQHLSDDALLERLQQQRGALSKKEIKKVVRAVGCGQRVR
jgi:hypothetical protein